MAGFNVGFGLAQAGETVAKFAGVAGLESQRSALEMERMKLANSMASEREEKDRTFRKGEREATQVFTAGESQKDRDNRLETTRMSNETSIKTAGIGAGATLEAARIGAASRSEENRLSREAAEKQHAATIEAQLKLASRMHINEDGTASMVDINGKSTVIKDADNNAIKFSNPDKARAQAETVRATTEQLRDATRRRDDDLRQAQAELKEVQKYAVGDPNNPQLQQAQKRVAEIKAQYEPQIRDLTQRLNSIAQSLATQGKIATPGGGGEGKRSLSDFDRTPKSGGLIDNH